MNKDALFQIMLDQRESFNNKSGLIERDVLLDPYLSTKQVVIISGVRRCGKSSLLSIIKNKLQLTESEYCYFNFDDERIVADIVVLNDIYSLHIQKYGQDPIFFLDEIQVVPAWEKFVNRMYEKGCKFFVTGSNAHLLSSEIATSLTGRNKVLELYPFSFNEYLKFEKFSYALDALSSKQESLLLGKLAVYIRQGGFPLVVKEKDVDLINSWFQDILYRDVIARYRITQIDELRQITLYLLSNIGKLFSYSTLKAVSGIKSDGSIKTYLDYLQQSYLLHYLSKFDYSIKKQMLNSKKVYAIDSAVAVKLGFGFSSNDGRLLENVIYLELLRRGKELYYFSEKNECDFIVKNGLQLQEAIQVSYSLTNENMEREIAGLKEAMKKYNITQGTVITFEPQNIELKEKNIQLIPAYKWLLKRL